MNNMHLPFIVCIQEKKKQIRSWIDNTHLSVVIVCVYQTSPPSILAPPPPLVVYFMLPPGERHCCLLSRFCDIGCQRFAVMSLTNKFTNTARRRPIEHVTRRQSYILYFTINTVW